jgi:excisionase family DNA binding protein
MAQKYYNVAEAAEKLGLTPAQINEMVLRRELYGYRDGADWKFKTEDIDRAATERGNAVADETSDNVLASEIELGASDPGLSGTVIGAERGEANPDSDIHLASDLKLTETSPEKTPAASGANLLESDFNLAGSHVGGTKPGDTAAGISRFEDIDMTLDHDLTLQESKPSGVPVPPANAAPAKPAPSALADSAVDLSGKTLEDDDLVLGGSGAGSDISIGGDSGISLVDPADSGLNLEAPLNLAKDEESLELGEDDLLGMASDAASVSGLKSEDDFQLTPMEDLADTDDSESGSQVIALDTEGEGDEAATLVHSGSPVAGLLDEDLGAEPTLAAMPMTSAATELGLAGPDDALMGGGAAAAALPEAPYSIWNILSLALVCLLLILVGMMMYELLRNMWGLNAPIKTVGGEFDSWLMDTILGWFEK